MNNDFVNSIFFGLGIFFQVFLLIGLKRSDFKELLKDIGGGLLFVFILLYATAKNDQKIDPDTLYFCIYVFYVGFIAAFTLSFKKRILLKINEIILLALNLVFLYYCITRLGIDNSFTKMLYLPTIIIFFLVLLKIELKTFYRGLLYLWYVMLFLILSLISIYQITEDVGGAYASYLASFFKGGIFLYIWIYIVYLIIFSKIIDYGLSKNRPDVRAGRIELMGHFNDLASSFRKSNASSYKVIVSFFVLLFILIINYFKHFISENFLIAAILFAASVSSVRRDEIIKSDTRDT